MTYIRVGRNNTGTAVRVGQNNNIDSPNIATPTLNTSTLTGTTTIQGAANFNAAVVVNSSLSVTGTTTIPTITGTGGAGPTISGQTTITANTSNPVLTLTQSGAGNALSVTGNVAITGSLTATIAQSNVTNLVSDLSARALNSDLTTHTSSNAAHGATGAVVGTTNTQTLTNKTISGSNNTLQNIAQTSVTNLVSDLASKLATTVTTKGDLISRDSSGPFRLPIGTNGKVLVADSTKAAGLDWGDVPQSTVTNLITDLQSKSNNAKTIDTKTTNYTLVLTDKDKIIQMNVASSNNVTVPAEASVNFAIGSFIHITNINTGLTTILGASGVIVNESGGLTLNQYESGTLYKRSSNTWVFLKGGGLGAANFSDAANGTFTASGSQYKYKVYTATGSLTITKRGIAEVLLIGGGGAGGGRVGGGGGGAGGLNYQQNFVIEEGTYTVTIGAGGTGVTNAAGTQGGVTKIGNVISAVGGGFGGVAEGSVGGSGGGGGRNGPTNQPAFYTNFQIPITAGGVGNAGSAGINQGNGYGVAGGGGGAGTAGSRLVYPNGGVGGDGIPVNIIPHTIATTGVVVGTEVYYAGGGGGGVGTPDLNGVAPGGIGGGGAGNATPNGDGFPAVQNTGSGGGGGGGYFSAAKGGNGSGGVVIIKVKVA